MGNRRVFSLLVTFGLAALLAAVVVVDAQDNPTAQPTPVPAKCECRKDVRCFTDINACRQHRVGVTLKSGDRFQCRDQPVFYTVYDCWEEVVNGVAPCRDLFTCREIPSGNGNQDPHFRGFDNSDYYFEGKAGNDYNIITDTNFQMNARFVQLHELKGTYMGRLGFRFGDHALLFDSYFGVFWNGSVLASGQVELPDASFEVDSRNNAFQVVLRTDVYQITARSVIENSMRAESYINVGVNLVGMPSDPHGILGQTANIVFRRADSLDLDEANYLVKDGILGTDFPVNRFAPKSLGDRQRSMGARLGRAVNPAFGATVDK